MGGGSGVRLFVDPLVLMSGHQTRPGPLTVMQCSEHVMWGGEERKGWDTSNFIPESPLSSSLNKHLVCPPDSGRRSYTSPAAPPELRTG